MDNTMAALAARGRSRHGDRWTDAGLAPAFIPYYQSGARVRVAFVSARAGHEGEVYETLTGTIGVTTGWRPAFLLMRTSRSIGSPYLLSRADRVVAVQQGRTYVPVSR